MRLVLQGSTLTSIEHPMPRPSGRGAALPWIQTVLSLAHGGAADGHAGDEDGGDADTDRDRLPVLAACPATVAELEVVADC